MVAIPTHHEQPGILFDYVEYFTHKIENNWFLNPLYPLFLNQTKKQKVIRFKFMN